MDYLTRVGETESTEPPGQCELCKGGAITRVPMNALKRDAVSRISGLCTRDTASLVTICASCMLIHCDETYDEDGPPRGPDIRQEFAKNVLANRDHFEKGSRSKADEAFDYAEALLRVLERGGYHIYLRSDGKQIILSHQDGLDRQTRGQVERYRREISEVIIERLWNGLEDSEI